MYVDILAAIKNEVKIPVAIKLSPFFSAMAAMAKRLADAGADGLVLFNRFYQPDIDLDTLEVVPSLVLSSSHELRLPLRWVAILHGNVPCSLAANSGISSGCRRSEGADGWCRHRPGGVGAAAGTVSAIMATMLSDMQSLDD